MVLLYHRIAKLESDPQLLAVSPQLFDEHLRAVKQHFEVISGPELVRAIKQGTVRPGSVVVTFDDGYADNLTQAAPILVANGVPATVFVSTNHYVDPRPLWWDELECLILRSESLVPEIDIACANRTLHLSFADSSNRPVDPEWNVTQSSDENSREAAYLTLHSLMKSLRANERNSVLEQVSSMVIQGERITPDVDLLSREQLGALFLMDGIAIGAHTRSHPSLSQLPVREQQAEITDSKTELEAILGVPVETFSYPFGSASDYSSETISLVRDAEFTSAFSNIPGRIHGGTDLFAIPRLATRAWAPSELVDRVRLLSRGIY